MSMLDCQRVQSLTGIVATATGIVVSPSNSYCTLQVTGITVATVLFEASLDGVTYYPVGTTTGNTSGTSGLSADGILTVNGAYKYLRARCSAYTSGTINAWLYY